MRELGPYRWLATEVFTTGGRDYTLTMDLPMGIYANQELTDAFSMVGATLEDGVTDAPGVVGIPGAGGTQYYPPMTQVLSASSVDE